MLADQENAYPAPYTRPDIGSVLIVEDDGLLSMSLEEKLLMFGASNVHCCSDIRSGLDIAQVAPIDCAILDVNAQGRTTYEIADVLSRRGIPFTFCTGLTAADLVEPHRTRPLLTKPYSDDDLRRALAGMLPGRL